MKNHYYFLYYLNYYYYYVIIMSNLNYLHKKLSLYMICLNLLEGFGFMIRIMNRKVLNIMLNWWYG